MSVSARRTYWRRRFSRGISSWLETCFTMRLLPPSCIHGWRVPPLKGARYWLETLAAMGCLQESGLDSPNLKNTTYPNTAVWKTGASHPLLFGDSASKRSTWRYQQRANHLWMLLNNDLCMFFDRYYLKFCQIMLPYWPNVGLLALKFDWSLLGVLFTRNVSPIMFFMSTVNFRKRTIFINF